MIVATVTALLLIFGGGGLGNYLVNADKAIKKTIEDKRERQEVLAITKQLGKDLKKENQVFFDAIDDMLELPQDHHASPEAFDKQADVIAAQQQHLIDFTLDAREQMRKRMTADQWHAVFKAGKKE